MEYIDISFLSELPEFKALIKKYKYNFNTREDILYVFGKTFFIKIFSYYSEDIVFFYILDYNFRIYTTPLSLFDKNINCILQCENSNSEVSESDTHLINRIGKTRIADAKKQLNILLRGCDEFLLQDNILSYYNKGKGTLIFEPYKETNPNLKKFVLANRKQDENIKYPHPKKKTWWQFWR
jgi:hypothetical protein